MASFSASITRFAPGRLPCLSTSTAARNWNGNTSERRTADSLGQLLAQFVDDFRRVRQDIAHIAEQREVTELAVRAQVHPRPCVFRGGDLLGRLRIARLREASFPTFAPERVHADQFRQRRRRLRGGRG